MLKLNKKLYWGICAAGAGIAASSFSAAAGGCTGNCGSCQFTCFTGICTGGFILAGCLAKKVFKLRDRKNAK